MQHLMYGIQQRDGLADSDDQKDLGVSNVTCCKYGGPASCDVECIYSHYILTLL
jgi:hypothetical protein